MRGEHLNVCVPLRIDEDEVPVILLKLTLHVPPSPRSP